MRKLAPRATSPKSHGACETHLKDASQKLIETQRAVASHPSGETHPLSASQTKTLKYPFLPLFFQSHI